MDVISQERLNALHTTMILRYTSMDTHLVGQGIYLRITQAGRTWAEQDSLYAMGRTTPSTIACVHGGVARPVGTCTEHPLGATVTNAKGGQSWHNYMLALDVVPMDPVPDWNLQHPSWQTVLKVAPTVGFKDGISWKDEPHLQPAELPDSPTSEVIAAYTNGGLPAVYDLLMLSTT